MEVYKSVYDLMLSKAISYGYVEQQVLAILTESHDRVELSMFKNIPDAERYRMAERWTWETLFEASDLSTSPKPKLKNCLAARPQKLGGKISEIKASAQKIIICVDASPEVSSGKQVPKPATKMPPTSPTSSPSERESYKRQKLTENSEVTNEKDPKLPGGLSITASSLADVKRQRKAPAPKTNRISETDAQEVRCTSALWGDT
ncbi:hypothetical protein BPAE_0004g00770 [Botrytis paeoniae]|uniref:Uncharacterized protein n=1 Tax=Botrytis paeoniae TaxID=278948 RepID=A0A4Z1G6G6_9HELO|nr:hypothetical protein BPAE_0004g00770 [Botrytis paeoniae]